MSLHNRLTRLESSAAQREARQSNGAVLYVPVKDDSEHPPGSWVRIEGARSTIITPDMAEEFPDLFADDPPFEMGDDRLEGGAR